MLQAKIISRSIVEGDITLRAEILADGVSIGTIEVQGGATAQVKAELAREAAKLQELPVGAVLDL